MQRNQAARKVEGKLNKKERRRLRKRAQEIEQTKITFSQCADGLWAVAGTEKVHADPIPMSPQSANRETPKLDIRDFLAEVREAIRQRNKRTEEALG